jgi:hypothetical protein
MGRIGWWWAGRFEHDELASYTAVFAVYTEEIKFRMLYRANSGFVAARAYFREVRLATHRLPESCGRGSDKT